MGTHFHLSRIAPVPLSYIHPLPGTIPLNPLAAALPPILYYFALLLLPPFPANHYPTLTSAIRNTLAISAATLFFRLPLRYHVPFSVGLTYQLALVGLYGGCRVLDAFFITYYGFGHTPRRIKYHHAPRHDTTPNDEPPQGPDANSYFSLHFLRSATGEAVTETAQSENGYLQGWRARASWAAELELSMRGAGFTWTSADVRHTKRTWRPSVRDRMHSIVFHVLPVLLVSWAVIRDVHVHYLGEGRGFDDLSYVLQAMLTVSLGAFLMAAFSFGYSTFAIVLAPLSPHPLSYFPPLYSTRIWKIKSVRGFWSYGWHRLFSRLFLVYGVWPGEWLERFITGKTADEPANVGKVLGGFLSSAFVHSFAGHTVAPGGWRNASGEAWFFASNGLAVVVEEWIRRSVKRRRTRQEQNKRVNGTVQGEETNELERWYDDVFGRIWWVAILIYTGRNFARGWVLAGLVREMAFA